MEQLLNGAFDSNTIGCTISFLKKLETMVYIDNSYTAWQTFPHDLQSYNPQPEEPGAEQWNHRLRDCGAKAVKGEEKGSPKSDNNYWIILLK